MPCILPCTSVALRVSIDVSAYAVSIPERIRTSNLRLRRPTRYPIVPRGQISRTASSCSSLTRSLQMGIGILDAPTRCGEMTVERFRLHVDAHFVLKLKSWNAVSNTRVRYFGSRVECKKVFFRQAMRSSIENVNTARLLAHVPRALIRHREVKNIPTRLTSFGSSLAYCRTIRFA